MTTSRTPDPLPHDGDHRTERDAERGILQHSFFGFNTYVTLQVHDEEPEGEAFFEEVRHACQRYERLFSRTLPHSDVSRLNAARGAWTRVEADTANLVEASLRYCEASEGTFDITMGTITCLWDIHAGIVPDEKRIQTALPHVDWRLVESSGVGESEGSLDATKEASRPTERWIRLVDPETRIDLGGTAKGWIADRIGELATARGIADVVINLGGNVLALGQAPGGRAWTVSLKDPRTPNATLATLEVKNAAVVTSGTYERCFSRNGRTYHHILDPKTGFPAETDLVSATVVAKRAQDAEGFSTTLLALGRDRALRLAEMRPEILAAILLGENGATSSYGLR